MINKTLFFLYFFLFTSSAHAYLDPGTGSIILQAILGAFAAFLSTLYIFWEKVKNFFRKVFKKNNKK
tara:strand:+ start:1173 stop:1373 length:201 start_codon:yes stop_codon:yes gene_type:complete